MDFKSLLQSMDKISETVHKAGPGGYGNRHGSETQTDQYGKPIGKVSLAKMGPKDDTPKSRGRPVDPDKPKTGKDDPKNQKVGDLFGRTTGDVPKGKKGSQHTPMKDADKAEKKAEKKSLKDWIEVSEHNQLNEEDVSVKPIQASQIIGADGKSMGTADPATANAIKAAAEKGTLNLSGDDSSSSSSSTQPMTEKFDKPVKTDPSEKGKYKGKSKSELLKAYNHLKKTGPHEKGSKQFENMKELAFAIRAKGDWGKVQEASNAFTQSAPYPSFKKKQRDHDSSVSGMGTDHEFRNRERNAGLEDEKNNYAVHIDGRQWKVFADKRQAENIARSLTSKGKKASVYVTGANPTESIAEGEGNFEKALDTLSGSWSGWHKVDSHNPGVDEYHFDDGEGGYYASGTIEHDLQTGQVTVDYSDQYENDVKRTFDSFGEAMRALRGGGGNHGGKAPNFDNLGHREPYTSDDLYKSDRVGRKGSLSGGASNKLKQSIQFNKGRLGPKGVLPEQGISEDDDDFEQEDEAYIACIVQHNRSGQAVVQRTKPISRDRAEEVIKHALSKNTFVHPPFMTIYPASAGKLDGSTIMAQFPDMSQEAGPVNTSMMEGKEKTKAKDLPGNQDDLDVAPPKGKLTGADFKALSKKKKVKEGRTMQVLESINFKELMASADAEVQEMLIELQNDVEVFKKTGHTSDLIDSFLKVHLHHNKNRITDEDAGAGRGYINPPLVNPSAPLPPARTASPGWGRDDYKPLTPDTSTGPAMGVNKGGTWTSDPKGTIRAPGGDPEGVKEGNFLSTLGHSNKTFESKKMKDIQLENWEKELNSLLTINEGITVSTSTGQQGSPDSVSVNATDGDSAELLQVLRQAGLGVFGGEEERSSYGSPMNSQEPTGAGSEPEMSPAVVGDGDDMMALIKKMSGIQDSGEPEGVAVVDVSSEEGDDEHSHYGSDNHDHEEDEVDEGNAFGQEVRQKKSDNIPDSQQRITTGGQNLPVKEEDHLISKASADDGSVSTSSSTGRIQATVGPNGVSVSPKSNGQNTQNGSDTYRKAQKEDESHDHEDHGTCNECGMFEARCVCEPGEEQVEEGQLDEISDQLAYKVNQARAGQHFAAKDKADAAHQQWARGDNSSMKQAQNVSTTAQAARDAKSNLSRNTELQKSRGDRLGKQMYEPATGQYRSFPQSMGTADGGLTRMKAPAQQMNHNYEESIEEDYANEAGHEEMAQLKHLLSMGNDMHKEKRSQAVGNPQQVTFETKLLKDSTSLLQDFKKLSGIK